MPDSAVIVPIELPEPLESFRLMHEPMAARGVPAHVTILYPFLPVERLTPTVRSNLAVIVATEAVFTTRFTTARQMGRMVWAVPSDGAPYRRLTAAIHAAWPDHPPYGGKHDDLIAHVTLLESSDPTLLHQAASTATSHLPFDSVVRWADLIVGNDTGRWRHELRLPLRERTS